VDTGDDTFTGGRLKRVSRYLSSDEPFCFTYGDGVLDVNISDSIEFHRHHGKLATVTSVFPPGRYGALECDGNQVKGFIEKPRGDGGTINGGFFVLSPKVLDFIVDDKTNWERAPLTNLASLNQLMAFEHHGFWQPMDTLRDKNFLEELWISGNAPWKLWT
jgi:glucose-1-phosphate cytidylyltransferase